MSSPKQTNPICPRCKVKPMMKNGSSKGRQSWLCATVVNGELVRCYETSNPSVPPRAHGSGKPADKPRKQFRRKIDTSKLMIFTSAQNATPVHKGFFSALQTLAEDENAELCIIPIRYKNATSVWTASQQNAEHWLRDVAEAELAEEGITGKNFVKKTGYGSWIDLIDDRAATYLYEQRRKLNNNLVVVGDVKVQPTMTDPLSSLEGLTHGESGIFGHTKLRMKCVATPQSRMPKILTTTGACTVPNYTDSKAGKKGEFHHVLGAVVVEIESPKKFHIYHINARKSDGAFIFIDQEYHPDGTVQRAEPSQALIFGDAHCRFADPAVVEATFDRLVPVLDPSALVWHDLLDCYFGNPHHKDNPFIRKAKHDADFHIAEKEVEETVSWAIKLTGDRDAYIVPSNHDDMFARWVLREDWKLIDTENMEFYLETALQMARSAKMSEVGAEYLDPFCYWVDKMTADKPNFVAMKSNQSLMFADIECGYHGDKGPRGARGTIKNLSQIGVKVISGHGHSPAIQDGHTRVGTMTRLTAEYVDGPNDWLNAHASIDAFGKRHLHFCIDGSFGFGI